MKRRDPARSLPVVDDFGRELFSSFIDGEIARGAWTPFTVSPELSGIARPMTIFLAKKPIAGIIKWQWHGDADTFCPPHWADIAIGSGACGYGCRSCFLMLTFRSLRDPLRPVVYTNGDDFDRRVHRWLSARMWPVEYTEQGVQSKQKGKKTNTWLRRRTAKDSIGLGIDCADLSLPRFGGQSDYAALL